MRVNSTLIAGSIIAILFISSIYFFAYPNTYLSYLNVSGKSEKEINQLTLNFLKQPLQLQIKDRVYQYTYQDLGIVLNKKKTMQSIYESNKKFPSNIVLFFSSFRNKRMLLPVLEFSEDYYQFSQNVVFDFSTSADEVIVNETEKRLVYKDNGEKFTINSENLRALIISNFGKKDNIIKPILNIASTETKNKVEEQNKKLDEVFKKPINLSINQENETLFVTIPATTMQNIVTLKYSPENNDLKLDVNKEVFWQTLENIISPYNQNNDKKISTATIEKDFLSLITSRLNGVDSNTLVTKIDYAPNSTGTLADKYIEIDVSQQRMFLFQAGSVINSYRISSGKYYPTPIGRFKILNKATNAFSNIYNVWMPYWMAFYYHPELKAYFGIHELPYWVSQAGQKIQRPREFIGAPNTGGCVALDIDTASKVYEFAEINMPVYIYN